MSEFSSVYYPDGVAPFGALEIVRIPLDGTRQAANLGLNAISLKVGAGSAASEAWKQVAWTQPYLLPDQLNTEADERLGLFIVTEAPVQVSMAMRHRSWPTVVAVDSSDVNNVMAADYVSPGSVVGWAGAQPYHPKGFRKNFYLIRHPEAVMPELTDVAVRPDRQGQNIGVALFDALLRTLSAEKPLLATVAREDVKLRRQVEALGFQAIAEVQRPILHADYPTSVVEFKAPSVQMLRNTLVSRYSWLDEAIIRKG